MFDTNLLFDTGIAITTSTATPAALDVGKTPGIGVDVAVVVTAASGTTPTFDCWVEESTATNASFTTVAKFDQITGTGRWNRVIQSKKRYLRLRQVLSGTSPSFTVTAGIVSGKQRDQAA